MRKLYLIALVLINTGCEKTEIPTMEKSKIIPTYTPLDVLGINNYTDTEGNEHQGGLYPNGSNTPPPAHAKAIQKAAGCIKPIAGKIGILGIGASSGMYEWEKFIEIYNADVSKNPATKIINGLQEGMTLEKILDPAKHYFDNVDDDIEAAGLINNQIQIVWIKTDTYENIDDYTFNEYLNYTEDLYIQLCQQVLIKYPKTQLIYFSGRNTSRYALRGYEKHFEPRAYYNNWVIKNLIQDQINGIPELRYKNPGKICPVLVWTDPFYSDGEIPNTYGHNWTIDDVIPVIDGALENGVHPSELGAEKCGQYLYNFFLTNIYTNTIF